jgi:hypothetical protein
MSQYTDETGVLTLYLIYVELQTTRTSKTSNWQNKIFTAVVNYLNIRMLQFVWLHHNTFRNCQRIFVLTLYNTFFYRSEVRTAGYQGHAVRSDKEIQDPARQHATVSGIHDRTGIKIRNENETGT